MFQLIMTYCSVNSSESPKIFSSLPCFLTTLGFFFFCFCHLPFQNFILSSCHVSISCYTEVVTLLKSLFFCHYLLSFIYSCSIFSFSSYTIPKLHGHFHHCVSFCYLFVTSILLLDRSSTADLLTTIIIYNFCGIIHNTSYKFTYLYFNFPHIS